MTNAPHGRGWEYVGRGYMPSGVLLSREIQRAVVEVEQDTWSQTIWNSRSYERDVPPVGGWFEFRMSEKRK